MKIIIAKDAGYCFGVRDAVNLAYDSTKKHGDVYMLGTIVHNERVVQDLSDAGTKVVKSYRKFQKTHPFCFGLMGLPIQFGMKRRIRI